MTGSDKDQDPFAVPSGDDPLDKTVMIPRPGGRRASSASKPPQPDYSDHQDVAAPRIVAGEVQAQVFDENAFGERLTHAAAPLLLMAERLANSLSHPDPAGLRAQVVTMLQRFEGEARKGGVSAQHVGSARYILCAMIDQAVMSTPWGAESNWSANTLLAQFHDDSEGGEKVFSLIERAQREPGTNAPLLELAYLAVMLGFRGKFGVYDQHKLQDIRESLFRTLRLQKPAFERALSPNWQGVDTGGAERLMRAIPLWAVAALFAGLLIAAYAFFSLLLVQARSPVAKLAADIAGDPVAAAPVPERVVNLNDRLGAFSPDYLSLCRAGDQARIILRGHTDDGALFATNSAQINARYDQGRGGEAIIAIAEALREILVDTQISISGHTDSRGSDGVNRALSRERAIAAKDAFVAAVPEIGASMPKIHVTGKAADERLRQDRTDRAARKTNRRVEIDFKADPQDLNTLRDCESRLGPER